MLPFFYPSVSNFDQKYAMPVSPDLSSHHAALLHVLQLCMRIDPPADCELTLPPGLQLSKLCEEAQRQGVAPWIHEQIQTHYASHAQAHELLLQLRAYRLIAEARNQQNRIIFQQLSELLGAHQIPVTPLKGLALALDHYPSPGLRPIGDIDVYVPSDKVFEARDLLMQHGAVHAAPPLSHLHELVHAHVRALRWNGQLIELHQRLYDLGSKFHLNTPLEEWIVEDADHNRIQPQLLSYHLITHLYHNLKLNGCRLSWLLDIALLYSRSAEPEQLFTQTIGFQPAAQRELCQTMCYCLPLMNSNTSHRLQKAFDLKPQFLDAVHFRPSEKSAANHKRQVVAHIVQLPGMHRKIYLLWKEFFPDRAYMDWFYPVTGTASLLKFYLYRMVGLRK